MDNDLFILSFKTKELKKDVEYFNDNFDFSELDQYQELYDCKFKQVIGKMKLETSPIFELTESLAKRSKSYSYSYGAKDAHYTNFHSKQKRIQKPPNLNVYKTSLFNSKITVSTNYSIRSNAHNLTVQKQNKLALSPFDLKRMYIKEKQSFPKDKHVQSEYCPCIRL